MVKHGKLESKAVRIGRCPVRRRAAALRMLCDGTLPWEQEAFVNQCLLEAKQGTASLDGLFVASRRQTLLGSILFEFGAGRILFVWPPATCPGLDPEEQLDVESRLLAAMAPLVEEFRPRYAQMLIDPNDRRAPRIATAAGFEYLSKFNELRLTVRDEEDGSPTKVRRSPPPGSLGFVPTSDKDPELEAMLRRVEVGTQDCRKLIGLARYQEMIEGYAARGELGSAEWRLATLAGEPVGCLLLAVWTSKPLVEVVYLGLIPQVRGRGLGAELIHEALRVAKSHGARWLDLAVDAANKPAVRLYKRLGFCRQAVRRGFILPLYPANAASDVLPPTLPG